MPASAHCSVSDTRAGTECWLAGDGWPPAPAEPTRSHESMRLTMRRLGTGTEGNKLEARFARSVALESSAGSRIISDRDLHRRLA